jgi:hypothetical protein
MFQSTPESDTHCLLRRQRGMCTKITYLCACGHYTTTATLIPCRGFRRLASVALRSSSSADSSTSSNGDTARKKPATYQSHRRNVASEIRNVRTELVGGVGTCKELNIERKASDPYWKSRWCEECTKKGCDARKRLLEEFQRA